MNITSPRNNQNLHLNNDLFNSEYAIRTNHKQFERPENKVEKQIVREKELKVFYTPMPRHVVRTSYFELDGKRVMNLSNHRFESLKDNTKTNNLSSQSARKLRYAINWLVESAKVKRVFVKDTKKAWFFKVGFLTLTFPARDYNRKLKELLHAERATIRTKRGLVVRPFEERQQAAQFKLDAMNKEMLHNFLVVARKKWQLYNFVWKAEVTEAGILHFHLSIDAFAEAKKLQRTWAKILTNYGFTDDFYKMHSHRNPPCTHIKAVKKVKNLAAYIATYMAKKEEGKRIVSGRSWGCSELLQYSLRLKIDVLSQFAYHYDKTLYGGSFRWISIDTIATNLTSSIHLADIYLLQLPTIEDLPHGDLREDILAFKSKLRQGNQKLYYEMDFESDFLNQSSNNLKSINHSFNLN